MNKAKKILLNPRVIILLLFIVFALFAIEPSLNSQGVIITSIDANTSASLAGFNLHSATDSPMDYERIISINNQEVIDEQSYNQIVSNAKPGETLQFKTNDGLYRLTVLENVSLGLNVANAPSSNIRKGLDLQGGIRVLLQPEEKVSEDDLDLILTNLQERLNVFGLSDVIVREASDLSGNQYILVEMAGAQEAQIKDLIAKQGVFEAKIGNDTAFSGGDDLTYVCRSSQCSGIDPSRGCGTLTDGSYACAFRFSISLSPVAASRVGSLTGPLEVIQDPAASSGAYLSEQLRFVLDGQEVDALNIGADLKGQVATDISISGSGSGPSEQAAVEDALNNMKRMQTILVTGSLPVKLNIVKTDTVSAVLGKEFVKSAFLMGALAILAVSLVVLLIFRRWEIALPMLLTMIAEVVILLGVAALIRWNLDLAAIAGILVAVGTGVDDQIVIADETLRGANKDESFKQKLKKAFFIIFGAYLTTMFAMVPLLFAGAGLVKGFAITTMIGVTIGVFVTRPAFAAVVEKLLH